MRLVKRFFLLAIFMLALIGCEEKKLVETDCVYLNEKLALAEDGNACKIFDVAIDTQRDRLYVHSIVSPDIAVIDTRTDALLEFIDTGLDGYHIAYMDVNTSTGNLFVADQGSNRLIKIDPAAGHVSGDQVEFDHTPTKILVTSAHVYVAFASQDELKVYRCSDLGHVKTLDCDDGIFAPQGMKSRDGKVYVALSRGQESRSGSTSGLAIIDPDSWKVTSISCEHKGATEIAVNAAEAKFWLLSESRLRATDANGTLLATRTFDCEAKEVLYSRGLGQVMLLTRDGGDSSVLEAPYGTLELLDPDTLSTVTKYRLGPKTSRMAVHGGAYKVYAASMASGVVSVVDYEDQVGGESCSSGRVISEKYSRSGTLREQVSFSQMKTFSNSSSTGSTVKAGVLSVASPKRATSSLRVADFASPLTTPSAGMTRYHPNPSEHALNETDSFWELMDRLRYESVADSIDVGSSIEGVLAHPDGNKVYLLSRLGGSQIHLLDISVGTIETIDVDQWPTSMALDEDRRELYVLSHYEAKIDVIDIDTNKVVDRIDLVDAGVARCRTHFLSDMAYDSNLGRLYCTFPELGLLVEVAVEERNVMEVVEAFDPASDADGGPQVGRAQLAVDRQSSRVFLFLRHESSLEVRDPFQEMDVVQTISFSSSTFSDNDYASRLLTADSHRRRLFVGPRVYSISAGKLSYEETLSSVEKVAAVDDGRGYLLGVYANHDKSVMVRLLDGSSYEKLASSTISSMETYPPRLTFDPVNDQLYATYMDPALVEVYGIHNR